MKDFMARMGEHAVALSKAHAAMAAESQENGDGAMANHFAGVAQEFATMAETCLGSCKTQADSLGKAAPADPGTLNSDDLTRFLRIEG